MASQAIKDTCFFLRQNKKSPVKNRTFMLRFAGESVSKNKRFDYFFDDALLGGVVFGAERFELPAAAAGAAAFRSARAAASSSV